MQVPDFKSIFGKNVPILSGAIHYFRVHPEYWRDRLLKLKACGLNTVETYVPWNLHEPKEGQFNFEGLADIVSFVQLAGDLGLKAIVRPGPYICSEWEYGGLPAWINKDRNMRIRCNWPPFLEKVKNYFSVLLPKLVPLLDTKGGPIIGIQVENEYGSFAADKDYLNYLANLTRELGIDTMLFTSDGWNVEMLEGGTLPDLWKTANFGSNPQGAFEMLRKFQPDGPDMCMEFWCGWFDHWGKGHHTRSAEDMANTLDGIIKDGGSVNVYMCHGGTNFGFWNGANLQQPLEYFATTTSYDYHAPLSEAGDITPAYAAAKATIEKYYGPAPDIHVENTKKIAYGEITFNERYSLWDNLPEPVKSAAPLTMEELDQELGYVLYRTTVKIPKLHKESGRYGLPLRITGLRDRAVVYVDGRKVGVLYRNTPHMILELPKPTGDSFRLDILVENMGRVNYGHDLQQQLCGVTGSIILGGHTLFGWENYSLPFNKIPNLKGRQTAKDCPAFYQAIFNIDETADTFLHMDNFAKGFVFVNGFNIGRYWEVGPARTLYIPAPLLKQGENEVTVFEFEGCNEPTAKFVDNHVWIK